MATSEDILNELTDEFSYIKGKPTFEETAIIFANILGKLHSGQL